MARIYSVLGLFMVLTFTSACSMMKSEKDDVLFNKVEEIRSQIEQEEWDEAFSSLIVTKKEYENRKWKMQLLGSQKHYQGIEREIDTLIEIIKERDTVESKSRLLQIKHYLTVIYNF
ncbi:DUF4363 family protein [Paenibacillus alkalitolerans]|uniref:DUF4363 family protein n=1 Tax=Paenibacillus alkalitolerans TaxID=2799335 RepID=UPI0018F7BA89|nr:hypothetical protein [Paenibacillus alkalitolerans]